MRKIEQQMNTAISDCVNWKNADTEVVCDNDGVSTVYLYGNKIAEVGEDFVQIFDGGYQSKTTKSRLNAILSEHAIEGEYVFQRNFKWFVHKFVGQAGQSKVYNEFEFDGEFMFS